MNLAEAKPIPYNLIQCAYHNFGADRVKLVEARCNVEALPDPETLPETPTEQLKWHCENCYHDNPQAAFQCENCGELWDTDQAEL